MPDGIRLDIDGPLARITLDRPARLNALDFAMGGAYRDACVTATSTPSVAAIILCAEGPAFCAGGDVLAMASSGATGAEVTAAAHVIHEGIRALTSSAIPVVAAARGAVAGGGIGLLLAADAVVASPTLRVAGRYVDVGLTPDLGVSTLLARAVGERRALAILTLGRELDAETALAWGMVDEVNVEPEARAEGIARSWAEGASAAFGHAKRLVRASSQRSFAESLDDEAATIGAAFDTDEARRRIGAFAAASAAREAGR
ncbi:enoyl-CoA hydratase/isomerase family protein [Demequina sp. NBRC 110057]|uniref:enoyl-CoA hydratase/isomerase family protein n=1 Tax=Demequina sp. NBRC 110057 TaxID=1570346 RepID=UPI0009FCA678|nr:enoyl-CoA hydratase-related protein [Demequina sp. NBRC 110057]